MWLYYEGGKYAVVDCDIHNKILYNPEAKIKVIENFSHRQEEFLRLEDEDGYVIFQGYVSIVHDKNTLTLTGISKDYQVQLDELKQKTGKNPTQNRLEKADLVLKNEQQLKLFDVFETEGKLQVNDSSVLKMDWKLNTKKDYSITTYVKWGKIETNVLDLGATIFSDEIDTLTPESLINDWPVAGSDYKGLYILDSDLKSKFKEWKHLKNDKYAEVYSLKGKLVVQKYHHLKFNEIWDMHFNNNSMTTEKIKLFIDMNKYMNKHLAWKVGSFYTKGAKVLFDLDKSYKIMKCLKDHIAQQFIEDNWEEEEDEFFYDNENVLLKSNIGKSVCDEVLKTFSTYLLVKAPEVEVEFTGDWEIWKKLEIQNNIGVKLMGQVYELRVYEYYKTAKYGSRYVKVKCHGYAANLKQNQPYVRRTEGEFVDLNELSMEEMSMEVLNKAESQLQDSSVIHPTVIKYNLGRHKTNFTNKITIDLGWNLA